MCYESPLLGIRNGQRHLIHPDVLANLSPSRASTESLCLILLFISDIQRCLWRCNIFHELNQWGIKNLPLFCTLFSWDQYEEQFKSWFNTLSLVQWELSWEVPLTREYNSKRLMADVKSHLHATHQQQLPWTVAAEATPCRHAKDIILCILY